MTLRSASGPLGPGGYPLGSGPLVRAYQNAVIDNVTGNGTYYTVAFNTEVLDRTGNYNPATGLFTAPFAGAYQFSGAVAFQELGSASRVELLLLATSQNLYMRYATPGAISGFAVYGFSETIFLAANDTCGVQVAAFGLGGNTADIYGTATSTRWSYLVVNPVNQT